MTAVGKVIAFPPGGGSAHRIGADQFRLKGEAADRGEAFSVIEYQGAPHIPGPPPHVHRSFEEAWYVLEGEVEFTSRKDVLRAAPGTYLYVPRGVPHTFRVLGATPARWVGIFAPGRYVALLEELGALLPAAGPPDPQALAALFGRYDTDLV